MLFSKFKSNSILEFILVSFLIGIFSYLIAILFSYPYYSIGSVGENSAYDGEPDYFANIISTLINGHSMDFLHPGVPINQLSAFMINLFSSTLTVEQIIEISRAIIIFFNCMMIYIGSRLFLQQHLILTILLIGILIAYPAGFILIDNLSPNSILFGLSVLLTAIGTKLEYKITSYHLLYGFLLGLAISIKYISLIIALPLFVSLIFDSNMINLRVTKAIKTIFFIVLISFLSFMILAWPILPVTPYILTHHEFISPDLTKVFQNSNYILILFFLVLPSFFILAKGFKVIINKGIKDSYHLTCIALIFLVLVVSALKLTQDITLISLGHSLRNFLPILGMIVLFVPYILNILPTSKRYIHIFSAIFFISMVFFKINFNNQSDYAASLEQKNFSLFIEQYNDYDFLAFYPPSAFISTELFVAWADYRYGDSRVVFSDQKALFRSTPMQKKIRIINSRKFDLMPPNNKPSYRYFDAISKSKFFSKTQKQVALNQMNLLSPKSLCTSLFDGFNVTKRSILFFPQSLGSYIENDNLINIDVAKSFVSELKNELYNSCKIDSEISESSYKDQIFYVLAISPSYSS